MKRIVPILIVVGLLIAALFIGAALFTPQVLFQKTVEFRVTKTENVCRQSKCQYLVYTDVGTFKNTDNWMVGKFNSSDIQGRLIEGRSYTARVGGYRIPIFSQYQNILRADWSGKMDSDTCRSFDDLEKAVIAAGGEPWNAETRRNFALVCS